MSDESPVKYYGGKPRTSIDEETVKQLAGVFCTNKEIAAKLGISLQTLQKHYSQALVEGRGDAHTSLRSAQYRVGVVNGNANMLIFLGKQYLGQSDKVDTNNNETRTTINITPDAIANKIDSLLNKALSRDANAPIGIIEGEVGEISDDTDRRGGGEETTSLSIEEDDTSDQPSLFTDIEFSDLSSNSNSNEGSDIIVEDDNNKMVLYNGDILSGEELDRLRH